jgi:hypothetical protein
MSERSEPRASMPAHASEASEARRARGSTLGGLGTVPTRGYPDDKETAGRAAVRAEQQ